MRIRGRRLHWRMARVESCAWLLPMILGCGRLNYESLPDGGETGPCLQWSAFSAPVAMLSEPDDQWLGGVSRDELVLLVHPWSSQTLNDVYISRRSSRNESFPATVAVPEFNTDAAEHGTVFSADSMTAYFASDRPGGLGSFDLYFARRPAPTGVFETFVHLEAASSTGSDDNPWIAPDGLRLYFESNRNGVSGIWMATRASVDADFSDVEMIEGLDVARPYSPSLTEDELEIFFGSQAPGFDGEWDIWHATRASRDDPFDPPEPLVEVNTPNDDVHPDVSADGTALWLNYDTETAGGMNSDVWRATRTCLER